MADGPRARLRNRLAGLEALLRTGPDSYESDRMLRLAGEALIGRIGDSAPKLRDHVGDDLPGEVPWDDVIANRIIVDQVYHRVDYDLLWNTLERDVPQLGAKLREWVLDKGLDVTDPPSTRNREQPPPGLDR